MVGNRNSGRRPKPTAEHLRDGTFRPHRHADRGDAPRLQIPAKPGGKVRAGIKSQRRWFRNAGDERAFRNGCRFNERLAEHVVSFFRDFLRHSKGSQWAGEPFEFLPWQLEGIICPLFGWVKEDGTRRFRRTYCEIPKKNGKSTIASGIGLYLLVADEEPGAEVYSAGADKDQARIVHNEAINMIEASPELDAALRINRTTGNISFEQTRSYYRALSAAPAGKHGLNAHACIIDELHEWKGRSLWDAFKYAYAARRQPLQFVITNAGNDLQTVCWEQHELAQAISTGKIHDDSFFGLIKAADPEDDWTDPAVWRKVNPSMDTALADPSRAIILEEDFQRDFQDSQNTPSEQPNFKRLRLGIWTTVAEPWLLESDWNACQESFTEDDLAGRECYGGLDLSKTRDMTAFVLCFPDGEDRYIFLPYFWLPEDAAMDPRGKNYHLYRQWVKSGLVTTMPGNTVEYSYVRHTINQCAEKFDLRGVGFDDKFASELVQALQDDDGLYLECIAQKPMTLTDPTLEFERLVLKGGAIHDGNPVLAWQAGHVTLKRHPSGLVMIVKPPHGDHRKIDGIAAAIMALSMAKNSDGDGPSVYEQEGQVAL